MVLYFHPSCTTDHENRKIKGRLTPFARYSMICQGDKRTNNTTMLPTQKSNAAAGYQGPVKIEILKGLLTLQPNVMIYSHPHCVSVLKVGPEGLR